MGHCQIFQSSVCGKSKKKYLAKMFIMELGKFILLFNILSHKSNIIVLHHRNRPFRPMNQCQSLTIHLHQSYTNFIQFSPHSLQLSLTNMREVTYRSRLCYRFACGRKLEQSMEAHGLTEWAKFTGQHWKSGQDLEHNQKAEVINLPS